MAFGDYVVGDTDNLGLFDANGDQVAVTTWESANSSVVSVTSGGTLTANAAGVAIVRAKNASNVVIHETPIVVRVANAASRYRLDVAGVAVGGTTSATVKDGNNNTVSVTTWTSSVPGVATINGSGTVTGVAKGVTLITARDGSNNILATGTVHVVAASPTGNYRVVGA